MASLIEMQRRLLVRPLPMFGESVRGYLMRVADMNGLLPEVDLYGLVQLGTVRRRRRVSTLRLEDFGLSEATVRSLGCRQLAEDETWRELLGHRIASMHHRSAQCAVCPQCLGARPAVWADWELKAQVACPEHGRLLIDTCPGCNERIRWRRDGVCICTCRFDLRRAKAPEATEGVLSFANAIRHRVFGDLSTLAKARATLPEFLLRCDLNRLLGTFQLFAKLSRRGVATDSNEPLNATATLDQQAAIVAAVAKSLSCWPSGWDAVLNALSVREARRTRGDPSNWLCTEREAKQPFKLLDPFKQPAYLKLPNELSSAVRSYLFRSRVFIGKRRLFATGERSANGVDVSSIRLKYLRTPAFGGGTRYADARDKLSEEALRDLFYATEYQLRVLCEVGLLPRTSWATVLEVDAAFVKLKAATRGRRRSADFEMLQLSEFSVNGGDDLARTLRQALEGKIKLARWAQAGSFDLFNLFVDAPFVCSPCQTGQ